MNTPSRPASSQPQRRLPTRPGFPQRPTPPTPEPDDPFGGVEVEEITGPPVPVRPTTRPTRPAAPAPQEKEEDSKAGIFDVGDADEVWDDFSDLDEQEEEEKRQKKKQQPPRKDRNVSLTDRDIEILGFLARYRYATYPQIARAFGTTPVALRQRFPRLAAEKLIEKHKVGQSGYAVWLPTASGVRLSGYDLATPTLKWGTLAHTLGLVDIGIRFEDENEVVVTEREIRAADTRDRNPTPQMLSAMQSLSEFDDDGLDDVPTRQFIIPMGVNEGSFNHIPDMVLVRPRGEHGEPASVAIELELNRKPATQWRKILKAYKMADNIAGVIYFTHKKDIARSIIRAAEDVGAADIVQARPFKFRESLPFQLPS